MHKGSGERFQAKNRTEFFGRSRKKVSEGCQLYEINDQRQLLGQEPFNREDFEVTEVILPTMSLEKIQGMFLKYISDIETFCGTAKTILLVGGKGNFRDEIPLPVKYKGSRDDKAKPLALKELTAWAKTLPNCKSHDGVEADDVLAMYGYKGYLDYKKTGKFSYIVSSNDKDQAQTPSLLFNWTKRDKKVGEEVAPDQSIFKQPYFLLIPSSGSFAGNFKIDEGNDARFYGLKGLAYQLICGDPTDDYGATYKLKGSRSYAKKSFQKDFDELKSAKDIMEKVCKVYIELFPDGVRFTPWNSEKEVHISWHEWLSRQFQCAYMLRSFKDDMTSYKLLDNLGIDWKTLDVDVKEETQKVQKKKAD